MSQKVLDFEASLVKAYKGVYVIDSLRNMHELIIDNWQLSVDLLDQVQECAAAPVSKFLVSGAAGHELYKTNKQFKHLMDAGGGYGTPYAFCFHKKKNPGYSEGVLAFAKTGCNPSNHDKVFTFRGKLGHDKEAEGMLFVFIVNMVMNNDKAFHKFMEDVKGDYGSHGCCIFPGKEVFAGRGPQSTEPYYIFIDDEPPRSVEELSFLELDKVYTSQTFHSSLFSSDTWAKWHDLKTLLDKMDKTKRFTIKAPDYWWKDIEGSSEEEEIEEPDEEEEEGSQEPEEEESQG